MAYKSKPTIILSASGSTSKYFREETHLSNNKKVIQGCSQQPTTSNPGSPQQESAEIMTYSYSGKQSNKKELKVYTRIHLKTLC